MESSLKPGLQVRINDLCRAFVIYLFQGYALVEIVILWLAITVTIFLFYPVNPIAAYLLIPYIAWYVFQHYTFYPVKPTTKALFDKKLLGTFAWTTENVTPLGGFPQFLICKVLLIFQKRFE